MKAIFLILNLLTFSQISFSQTAAEWTQQKKTQNKYLLQQIGALQVYLGYVKKGYDLAHTGIALILKPGDSEWNLHKRYFTSLFLVNPAIRKSSRVRDILLLKNGTAKLTNTLLKELRQGALFNKEEIDYIVTTTQQLHSECLTSMDDLMTILTPGKLVMKDDERLERMETIYASMRDRYSFLQSFANSVILLSNQRRHEKMEVEISAIFDALN